MGWIAGILGDVLIFLLNILPDSPVPGWLSEHGISVSQVQDILGYLNYFVPLQIMYDITLAWSGLMGALWVYYGIRNRLGS